MNQDALNYCTNEMIPRIKAEARRRIVAMVSPEKQQNNQARWSELIWISEVERPLTDDEKAEQLSLLATWRAINAIRARSNEKEAELLALTTLEEVSQYDIMAGWP